MIVLRLIELIFIIASLVWIGYKLIQTVQGSEVKRAKQARADAKRRDEERKIWKEIEDIVNKPEDNNAA